jgi:hypothetical protein
MVWLINQQKERLETRAFRRAATTLDQENMLFARNLVADFDHKGWVILILKKKLLKRN